MKKRIGLIILLITMMVLATGCEVSHKTEVNNIHHESSIETISTIER